MRTLLILVGVFVTFIGLTGLMKPSVLTQFMANWPAKSRYYGALLTRLIIGLILVFAYPQTRFPMIILILGILTLVAAGAIAIMGQQRLDKIIAWFLGKPLATMRRISVIALLLGLFIIYAAI